MKKIDLLTGEEFETNRVNQNFASAKNRIKYYNEKAKMLRQKAAFINKPLHNNLRILDELMANTKELSKHKEFLLGKGFNFGVHTHYEKYKGTKRIALYQYIIIPLENEQIKIIKK